MTRFVAWLRALFNPEHAELVSTVWWAGCALVLAAAALRLAWTLLTTPIGEWP